MPVPFVDVAIIGAGAAGLTAATVLQRNGLSTVILERSNKDRILGRQRAGVIEARAVEMFHRWGLGELVAGHDSAGEIDIRVGHEAHRIGGGRADAFQNRILPQQVLVSRLLDAYQAAGGSVEFGVESVAHESRHDHESVHFRTADGAHTVHTSIIAGADGDRGVSRSFIPQGVLTRFDHPMNLAWLSVMAEIDPVFPPVMAVTEDGFAAQFPRGRNQSRFYLECAPSDTADDWTHERIIAALRSRLDAPNLDGAVTNVEVITLRSSWYEPMSNGRVYLLGDAAHIVSPASAKGLNMALYDADVFAEAVIAKHRSGSGNELSAYSANVLRRVRRLEEYSVRMTEMLHFAGASAPTATAKRLAEAQVQALTRSAAASDLYAEYDSGYLTL
jgi:p-hydroxybenzoate 3-monooxygenase